MSVYTYDEKVAMVREFCTELGKAIVESIHSYPSVEEDFSTADLRRKWFRTRVEAVLPIVTTPHGEEAETWHSTIAQAQSHAEDKGRQGTLAYIRAYIAYLVQDIVSSQELHNPRKYAARHGAQVGARDSPALCIKKLFWLHLASDDPPSQFMKPLYDMVRDFTLSRNKTVTPEALTTTLLSILGKRAQPPERSPSPNATPTNVATESAPRAKVARRGKTRRKRLTI